MHQEELGGRALACLAAVADLMIPASADPDLPGGGDPAIVAAMVASLDRDRQALGAVLDRILGASDVPFEDLSSAGRLALVARLRSEHPAGIAVLEAVVARAYYRDPRVLEAIGLDPRPPYPAGFTIEPGDWSLLDPVRARGPIWRRVP